MFYVRVSEAIVQDNVCGKRGNIFTAIKRGRSKTNVENLFQYTLASNSFTWKWDIDFNSGTHYYE